MLSKELNAQYDDQELDRLLANSMVFDNEIADLVALIRWQRKRLVEPPTFSMTAEQQAVWIEWATQNGFEVIETDDGVMFNLP